MGLLILMARITFRLCDEANYPLILWYFPGQYGEWKSKGIPFAGLVEIGAERGKSGEI